MLQGPITETVVAVAPDGHVLSEERSEQAPAPASELRLAAEMGGDIDCLEESKNSGFTAYRPPASIAVKGKNEFGLFQGFAYSVDNARAGPDSAPTFQVMMCGVGGVDAENGSRITVSGPGVFFDETETPYIIGKSWKEGSMPKNHSVELGFEVPARDAKVTGKITQNPTEELKGSIRPPYESEFGKFFLNAANAWWEDGCHPSCRWRFQGSGDYQGSVVEALWEFPQAAKDVALQRNFWLNRFYVHHCGNPTGCP